MIVTRIEFKRDYIADCCCEVEASADGEYVCYDDYTKLEAEKSELLESIKWFCKRVDSGEVRSVKTYAKFKELINKYSEE